MADRRTSGTRRSRGNGCADAISVLIVDDYPMAREGYKWMLARPGIKVVGVAPNGLEGVRLADELAPDVVLMDMRMPGMDGLAATAEIKKRHPETAVLVITAHESDEDLRRAVAAGASGYMLKWTNQKGLLDAIHAVHAGGSVIEGSLLPGLLATAKPAEMETTQSVLDALTEREIEVLRLITAGLTNKEIALRLHYSVGSVKNIVQKVTEKLQVSDRTQAAVAGVRAGLEAKDR